MILTGALKLSLVFWQDVNCICRSHLELGLPLSVHEVSKITRYPSIEMLRCLEISQGHLPQIGWTWIGLRWVSVKSPDAKFEPRPGSFLWAKLAVTEKEFGSGGYDGWFMLCGSRMFEIRFGGTEKWCCIFVSTRYVWGFVNLENWITIHHSVYTLQIVPSAGGVLRHYMDVITCNAFRDLPSQSTSSASWRHSQKSLDSYDQLVGFPRKASLACSLKQLQAVGVSNQFLVRSSRRCPCA